MANKERPAHFYQLFHILDSQVALSVLVKGRSSSLIVNASITKVATLTIAASVMPAYGNVQSDWNPSDGASCYWERGSRRRSSFPRRRVYAPRRGSH